MQTTRRDFLRISAATGGLLGLSGITARGANGLASPTTMRAGGAVSSPGQVAPLRILILGGTGFIGPYEVRYALERGHTVTLFNRGRTNTNLFPDVETLIGDRNGQLDALRGREWDVVIDNSGFYPRWMRDSAGLLKDSVDRYLFVSSISAYDFSLQVGQDEYTAPKATMEDPNDESESPYGRTYGARKALCEQELIDAFGEARSVIVRPGEISGPGDPTDRVRYWLARVDRGGEILVPGDPNDPVQHIDARDLTGWIVRLLEQGDSGPYNAVGPEARLSWAEFVYAVRAVTNSNLSFTWVDEEFLVEHNLSGRYVFPWVPAGLRAFVQINHARALATGLTYLPLATTLADMLEEYRAAGPGGIDPSLFGRLGVTPEREAEILAAWHDRQQ